MTKCDTLDISKLQITTHIGVHAWEQQILQSLILDISIPLNVRNCDDNLAKTIDYDALCQQVTTYVESNHFQLIETVAERVADYIKNTFQITQLTVSVSKPHAVKNASNVTITIVR